MTPVKRPPQDGLIFIGNNLNSASPNHHMIMRNNSSKSGWSGNKTRKVMTMQTVTKVPSGNDIH